MSRIELVREAVNHHLDSLYDLLALRLMFPPPETEVTIDQEIADLYTYPERLEASYRDEWRSIAVRACFNHGFGDHRRSDEENIQRFMNYLKRDQIPRCIHNNATIFRCLGEVLQIQQADNTLTFPDPRRKAVMRLVWPKD